MKIRLKAEHRHSLCSFYVKEEGQTKFTFFGGTGDLVLSREGKQSKTCKIQEKTGSLHIMIFLIRENTMFQQ
jgi:hypothetical protein